MKFPARKLLPLLVFLLSSFSIFRLLRIAITTTTSSSTVTPPLLPLPPPNPTTGPVATRLSKKEFKLLTSLIKSRAPCNLLIFGLGKQHLKLSSLNAGGNTLFLEDDSKKISEIQSDKSNATWIHKVDYPLPAKKAYELLKHARETADCGPDKASSLQLQNSTCRLALRTLPRQVYEYKWDVVVVDGPRGDSPDAPGRMSAIYTAGVLARASPNVTHVVVHDVHRTIEKWFSWEFLCHGNMVSSKGKLWSFRIGGEPRSGRFCPD
ncbi:unnamed protein product [Linum tenue]|uniref:Polysaccharide biosynthesis domain-containing protein n=1 Tax=Linum tenue TaxID=586396 RepID=A0AAV0MJR7_9ROSI|nr:unnamed protein product [Linum tenue]